MPNHQPSRKPTPPIHIDAGADDIFNDLVRSSERFGATPIHPDVRQVLNGDKDLDIAGRLKRGESLLRMLESVALPRAKNDAFIPYGGPLPYTVEHLPHEVRAELCADLISHRNYVPGLVRPSELRNVSVKLSLEVAACKEDPFAAKFRSLLEFLIADFQKEIFNLKNPMQIKIHYPKSQLDEGCTPLVKKWPYVAINVYHEIRKCFEFSAEFNSVIDGGTMYEPLFGMIALSNQPVLKTRNGVTPASSIIINRHSFALHPTTAVHELLHYVLARTTGGLRTRSPALPSDQIRELDCLDESLVDVVTNAWARDLGRRYNFPTEFAPEIPYRGVLVVERYKFTEKLRNDLRSRTASGLISEFRNDPLKMLKRLTSSTK